MKSKIMICLALCFLTLVFSSCEQQDWAEWRLQNQLWLENNKTQPGVITTHTGLQYKVVSNPNPNERRPNSSSYISASYKGILIDGTKFDPTEEDEENWSSYSGYLSSAIEGWIEGIQKMHIHDTYILYIPYTLAYGEDGSGKEGATSFIPPYSTLIFEVYLDGAIY